MSLEPGQIIDAKYRVVRRIGEGGMGTVYEGENSRIGRRVAIKVLHAQVAAMPEFVERFEREARAAARIGSPYVCDVLDLGDLPSGDRYIVMEYLDGVSFEDRIDNGGKLTPAQLAPIAFELLEGLGTMHAARVIHRDLKPANVFLSRTNSGRGESVKILDFGVAKLLPMGGEVGTMTQTGTMMGTPLYMSPEQARGARDVDGRTDIYAASVMFYRALTGVLPYHAETLNELLFKIVLEDPKPLREVAPEVDELFAEIVHKGLARDLTHRYATAREYQEAIAAWGRAQGRQSLSFAVTSAFDQPISSGPNYVRPASSPSHGQAGGTPIAWADDAARSARVPSGQATVMDRVGGSSGAMPVASATGPAPFSQTPALHKDPPVASGAALVPSARSGVDGNAAPANSTLASSAVRDPAPSSADPAIAIATTVPAVSIADITKTPQAAAKSKRGLVFGIAGVGALALVGVFAFGRGGGSTPTTTTGAGDNAQTNPSATPSAKETPVTASSSATTVASATPNDANATAEPAPSTHATTTPATATATPTTRPNVPATAAHHPDVPKAGTAAVTAAPVSAAPVPPTPPPSAAAAKPAGSARKFRTNID
jgi:serine/threonine-protein kinase